MAISASPTARPLRGYGRAGAQNDRLGDGRAVGDAEMTVARPHWSGTLMIYSTAFQTLPAIVDPQVFGAFMLMVALLSITNMP